MIIIDHISEAIVLFTTLAMNIDLEASTSRL